MIRNKINNLNTYPKIHTKIKIDKSTNGEICINDDNELYCSFYLDDFKPTDIIEKFYFYFDAYIPFYQLIRIKAIAVPDGSFTTSFRNLPSGDSDSYLDIKEVQQVGKVKIKLDITKYIQEKIRLCQSEAMIRIYTDSSDDIECYIEKYQYNSEVTTECVESYLIFVGENQIEERYLNYNLGENGVVKQSLVTNGFLIETPSFKTTNKINPVEIKISNNLFTSFFPDHLGSNKSINFEYRIEVEEKRVTIIDYQDTKMVFFKTEQDNTYVFCNGLKVLQTIPESDKLIINLIDENGSVTTFEKENLNYNDWKIKKVVDIEGNILKYNWTGLKLSTITSCNQASEGESEVNEAIFEYYPMNYENTLESEKIKNIYFPKEKRILSFTYDLYYNDATNIHCYLFTYKLSTCEGDENNYTTISSNPEIYLKYYDDSIVSLENKYNQPFNMIKNMKTKQVYHISEKNNKVIIKQLLVDNIDEDVENSIEQDCIDLHNIYNSDTGCKYLKIYEDNNVIYMENEKNIIIENHYDYYNNLLFSCNYMKVDEVQKYLNITSNQCVVLKQDCSNIIEKQITLGKNNLLGNSKFEDVENTDWISNLESLSLIDNNVSPYMIGSKVLSLPSFYFIEQKIDNVKGFKNENIYFSLFVKGRLTENEKLKIELLVEGSHDDNNLVYNQYNEVQEEIFYVDKLAIERKNYLNDAYQCIVGTIVPKYNYSNIIIRITNESLQNISIGNVRLFKGKALFYNEYDDNSQIIKTNIENEMTDYEYDSKYRISKVRNNQGITEYQYDPNSSSRTPVKISLRGKRTYKLIDEGNNHDIEKEQIYDENLNETINEYEYDEQQKLKKSIIDNSIRYEYAYDEFLNIVDIALYEHNKNKKKYSKIYTYEYDLENFSSNKSLEKGFLKFESNGSCDRVRYSYDKMNVSKMSITDGTSFQFVYDSSNNLTEVNSLLGDSLYKYEYIYINNYPSDLLYKKKIYYANDTYDEYLYTYIDNYLLKKIEYKKYINSIEEASYSKIYEIEYDENEKIKKVKLNNVDKKIFEYDEENSLVTITKIEHNHQTNENQNLNVVEKINYQGDFLKMSSCKINDSKITHYYDYYDESATKDVLEYLMKISSINTNDYFIFDETFRSSYSDKTAQTDVLLEYDDKAKIKIIKFDETHTIFEYNINDLNEMRNDGQFYNNIKYDKKEEAKKIKRNINIYAFINTSSGSITNNISFVDSNNNNILGINYTNKSIAKDFEFVPINVSINKLRGSEEEIYIENNEWNLIGISIKNSCLSINVNGEEVYLGEIKSSDMESKIETISKIRINITDIINNGSTKIAYINIGTSDFTANQLKSIYKYGNKYLNAQKNVKDNISGVNYFNSKIYSKFTMIGLLNSLVSDNGDTPILYLNSDYKYKYTNEQLFEYDEEVERSMYSSYNEKINEDCSISKSILSYQLDLENQGTITIRFKVEKNNDSSRTIFKIYGEDHSLGVSINYQGKIIAYINGTSYLLDEKIKFNTWNTLFVTYDSQKVQLKINYFPLFTVKNFNTTLNTSRVNIGCDIDEVDNAFNHLNGKIEMFGYSYSVLTDDEMTEILDSDGMISVDKRYDDNKKLIEKVITTNNNKLFVKYRYNKNAPTSELRELVSSELHSNGEETIYEYDFLGNVVKSATISKGMPNNVSLSFIKGKKYLYDDYGRLIEESYYKDSSIILEYNNKYHYDRNGDITSKEMDGIRYEYLYTGQLLTKITNQETEESIYEITYDNMYPKQIKKNNTTYNLLWEGTKLVQYGDNIFTYNEEGQRIRKETANKIYEYIYSNNCLVRCIKRYKETLNIENIIDYHYDEIGQLVGLSYEKNEYYYERDILGNINKIVDKNGEPVVSYEYDAYGNFTKSYVGYIGQILSNNNIFLYKGYSYDVETSLFWLSSRYYSPELCRFISPDDVSYLDPESVNGLNLYCYCLNNPIMYADPSGHWVDTVFDLFSLGVSIVEVIINPYDPLNWAGLAGDALDLIPFVTGVGETIKGVKVVAKGVDIADDAYDTIRIMKVADLTDDAWDTVRGLDRAGDFTQSTMSAGRKIHRGYRVDFPGKEFGKIAGIRIDSFDEVGKMVFELKPYNINSLKTGVSQLSRYRRKMGKGYTWILELY